MTKIFILGATGYIGGDALYAINEAHPDYEITALVRNSDKGAQVASVYPKIRLVYGDLDSSDLIEEESRLADIVCNFASADHPGATTSILRGLTSHIPSPSHPSTPAFLIHTSGTGLLCYEDVSTHTHGTYPPNHSARIWDDVADITDITVNIPDTAPHRNVDKLVLDGNVAPSVRTAIVAPPCIVGLGRGPGNKRSIQVPELCALGLKRGRVLSVGEGDARWSFVTVKDLSKVFVRLVEEAAAGGETAGWSGKGEVWGKDGYYFVESGEARWGDVAAMVAKEGKEKGWLKSEELEELGWEETEELFKYGSLLWGSNSRSRASRAREVLKWEAEDKWEDEIVKTLEAEWERSGLEAKHAKVAAGDA